MGAGGVLWAEGLPPRSQDRLSTGCMKSLPFQHFEQTKRIRISAPPKQIFPGPWTTWCDFWPPFLLWGHCGNKRGFGGSHGGGVQLQCYPCKGSLVPGFSSLPRAARALFPLSKASFQLLQRKGEEWGWSTFFRGVLQSVLHI